MVGGRCYRKLGFLLMEAIMACFLMALAFLVAVRLYGAALQWEASTGKIRQASQLAEQKMEEIRARSLSVSNGSTFAARLDGIIGGVHSPYPEAPSFRFDVEELRNRHQTVGSSGLTPEDGVHSPGSRFFTQPLGSATPYPTDPEGDFQRNATFESYPYSRHLPNSYRLVQVTVRWSLDPRDSVRLISLIGDPIPVPRLATTANVNQTVNVIKVSGPSNLTAPNSSAVYRIEVTAANGARIEDVSVIWQLHPLNDGYADLFALDASGTQVRISRNSTFSQSGTRVRLYPQVRYHGIEARAISGRISL